MKNVCKLCGETNFKEYLKDKGFKYFRCSNCSLVQLLYFPTDEDLKEAYSQKYYNEEKSFLKKFYWNLRESYEKLLTIEKREGKIKGLKLLDVGAGKGHFLDVAREFEAATYGSEISEYGKQEIIKKSHHFVDNVSEYKNYFDIITLWDVAEHLTEPKKEFKVFFDVLKMNGRIFIATSWIDDLIDNIMFGYTMWSDPPYHILLYNKQTLQKFLSNAGFKNILREKTHQSGNYYHYTKSFWLTKQIVKKYLRYGKWKRAKRKIQAGVGSYLFVSAQKL
jgi:2-polyprenyl-3-methyl-5-hydroxy-6-metoxy-1,4-benzoquinol methylase